MLKTLFQEDPIPLKLKGNQIFLKKKKTFSRSLDFPTEREGGMRSSLRFRVRGGRGGSGYAFCQALYKGIEGEDWEDMYDSYKEMSRAVGVRKPRRSRRQKFCGH